jgi:glycosyltransferase involved in cell wall biosynthesis
MTTTDTAGRSAGAGAPLKRTAQAPIQSSCQSTSMPKVSVCIPVYNGAKTVVRSITSVLNQSYQNFECIVMDNHSTDSTVEIVEAFSDKRIRIVCNESNVGLVANHNECLKRARGELIQFVHADDWLLPGCLERLVPTFETSSVGLAFAPRQVETDDIAWKARYGPLHSTLEPLLPVNNGPAVVRKYVQAGGQGNVIGEPTCVMVRRELLSAVGGFRRQSPQLMDIDASRYTRFTSVISYSPRSNGRRPAAISTTSLS